MRPGGGAARIYTGHETGVERTPRAESKASLKFKDGLARYHKEIKGRNSDSVRMAKSLNFA